MNGVFAETGDGSLAFVGDFARVYAENSDPWAQSGRTPGPMAEYYHRSRRRTAHMLKDIGAEGDALEIGCGHGHAIKEYRMMGPPLSWYGADISADAIKAARRKYPGVKFCVSDIAGEQNTSPEYDLIIWGEMLWYVLNRVDIAVTNTHAMLRPGGALVVTQGFLRNQRFGLDLADGFWGAAHLFQSRYGNLLKLIHAHLDEDTAMPLQHGVLAFRVAE